MRKYSLKFWLIFWTISAIFLASWFLYWNTKSRGISSTAEIAMKFLPIAAQQKNDYNALFKIGENFLKNDNQEKTLLVLFQNNLEIRGGGGFLSSFGVVKIKNRKIVSMETHDLSNFDSQIPNVLKAPYPLEEIMGTEFWKMRDSNWSPDFRANAEAAEKFYALGGGTEKFDGVIGITSNVLASVLKVTGPVQIEGYPGTYDSDNAILSLEYQVEKAFDQQGIQREDRKSIMSDLAKEIEKRVFTLSVSKKIELAKILLADLDRKDIQVNFKDADLQKTAAGADWTGVVDQDWNKDYLMTVDANLGSFKSDYYVKRSIDYTVDLSKEVPTASLKISYEHTARQKDWMTRDYTDYLRVYVPENSWMTDQKNFDNAKFGNDLPVGGNRKYFGAIVRVPIGTSKTVEINYTLPNSIRDGYNLKIQKQAGLSNIPLAVHVINPDGTKKDFSYIMNEDMELDGFESLK